MNKLWLIIKREYLSRVTKKTFIIATILTPLGIGLFMFIAGYIAANSLDSEKKVAIKDASGIVSEDRLKSSQFDFVFPTESIEELKDTYIDKGYDVLISLPALESQDQTALEAQFYSKDKLSLVTIESLESKLDNIYEEYKKANSGIARERLNALNMKVTLENALIAGGEGGEDVKGDRSSRMSIAISTGLSYIMGFLMYMVIFIYGGMVMRSVMEEKINRIVEVMISTVKPIQLMLGKIIGVGLVGLTQLLVWLVLIPVILFGISAIFGVDTMSGNPEQAMEMVKDLDTEGELNIPQLINEFKSINWMLILPTFIIYFLGGYFIYSSLFAAVGSAMGDDMGEGQQMMLPIVIPVLIAFIMIPSVFNNPDGPIAIFGSMFPLLSPILMPARLPFDPPMWQVLLSIVILLLSIVFFAWIAGRIYRIGILMYGKKMSFKEIGKWMFYKG